MPYILSYGQNEREFATPKRVKDVMGTDNEADSGRKKRFTNYRGFLAIVSVCPELFFLTYH